MWAGIIRCGNPDAPDARVGLHPLEGHIGCGEFTQISTARDTVQGVIWGSCVASGTGLHDITSMDLFLEITLPLKERSDFNINKSAV
jgi:hypothetical protein